MARKSYSGAAPATTLSGVLTSVGTSFAVASVAGYPTGSGGPFVICIDRGNTLEEKILITSVASTTFTVAASGRGYDGTIAVAHSALAAVEHVLDAVTLDEANDHVNTITRDDHTQYLNTTRHDVIARHTFGGAFTAPAVAIAVGTTASAGTAAGPARADHVHILGTGSVSLAVQFAAGVVNAAALGTGAVTTAKLGALAVDAASLAANAVTTSKILDANVTTAKFAALAVDTAALAAASVTRPKLGSGFTGVTVGTTAPSSPVVGEEWYDTTNNALKVYASATTGWTAPWNLPWGVIAYGSTATNQAGIGGTETDLTSLTASLPASWPANRRVRIVVRLSGIAGTTANDSFSLRIKEGATQLQETQYSISSSILYVNAAAEWILSPTAGAHTYKAALIKTAGGGTTDNGAITGRTALFQVEDIGPSAAPA